MNNAGYALNGRLEGTSALQWEQQFQTNVFGLAAVIREVLPMMRHQQHGTIINVASISGRIAVTARSHLAYFSWDGA